MFKKYIFAIFLNLFLLTVSQSQITPNRFDLLLETLTRPISGYVEGFKNEMSRNAKIYLNLSYPDEDIDDPQNTSIRQPKRNPPRHTVLVEDDEDVIDEGDIITEASSQRLLQGSICANGIQTTGNRTRYFYQGYEIGYDVALSLINGEPVTFYGETLFNISQVDAVVSPVTLCWCPLDYFGSRCQVQMPLLCEINQTIPQCPKIDPWLYSFNFTGDPPCLRVRKGNPFNFK